MSDAAYKLAKELITDIPESLFEGEQTYFEGQECRDCGGYFIEINKAGVVRQFSFGDLKGKDWPEEVIDFYEDFVEVISLLPK